MVKVTCACVWLLLWLVGGSVALAQPAALHWVRAKGAEACIEPALLAERVETLTGTLFVAPASAEVSLEGLVEPSGKGFRVRLASSRRGEPRNTERMLTSASRNCRELDAAVTFVIALTLDPSRALAGIPADVLATFSQEQAPEQTLLAELEAKLPVAPKVAGPLPEARPAAVAAPAPAPAPAPARPLRRYRTGVAGAALGGSAPHWLGGLRASFGLALVESLSLELALGAFPSMRKERLAQARSAVFQSYDATLSVCPGLRWSRWHALGCGGVTLSYLHARGRGFDRDRSAHIWDPAASVGLALGLHLARGVGLFASATLRIRFLSREFASSSGRGEALPAYRPDRFGSLFSLGTQYEF